MRQEEATRRAHEVQQAILPLLFVQDGYLDVGKERVDQRVEQCRLVGEVAVEGVRRNSQTFREPPHRQLLDPLSLGDPARLGEDRFNGKSGPLPGPSA